MLSNRSKSKSHQLSSFSKDAIQFGSEMTDKYDQILRIVAEEPGKTVDDLTALAMNHGIEGTAEELLDEAVKNEDVLEFDDRYWVMRKGKYSFDRFDHPES